MSHFIKMTIAESNGDLKAYTDIVARIPEGTTLPHLQRATEAFLLDWYAFSEWEGDDRIKVRTPQETLCWIHADEQLQSEDEFNVLCRHMDNQSLNINACLTTTT